MRETGRRLLNQAVDVRSAFGKLENRCFTANDIVTCGPASGKGSSRWRRHSRKPRMAIDLIIARHNITAQSQRVPIAGPDVLSGQSFTAGNGAGNELRWITR